MHTSSSLRISVGELVVRSNQAPTRQLGKGLAVGSPPDPKTVPAYCGGALRSPFGHLFASHGLLARHFWAPSSLSVYHPLCALSAPIGLRDQRFGRRIVVDLVG